jgi:hypothetical protein
MDEYTMVYNREGEGVPLVFIHQVATDRRLWHHQWRTFCRRYRLITVDTMEQAPKVLAYAWAACVASEPLDCLGAIHVPSLVSAGLYDLCTPPYLARAVADGLSKVEFQKFRKRQGISHFLRHPRALTAGLRC